MATTIPASQHPTAFSFNSLAGPDAVLQMEKFTPNSPALLGAGGAASLINVQKDADTLIRTGGNGITQADLESDLQTTGLLPGQADMYASDLKRFAASGDKNEIANELANILHTQGWVDNDHAQGYANAFVGLVGNDADNHMTYQNQKQIDHGGQAVVYTPLPPSSAAT